MLDMLQFYRVASSISGDAAFVYKSQLANLTLSSQHLHPNYRESQGTHTKKTSFKTDIKKKYLKCFRRVFRWIAFVCTVYFSGFCDLTQYRDLKRKEKIFLERIINISSIFWLTVSILLWAQVLLDYTCNLTDKEFKINRMYWTRTIRNYRRPFCRHCSARKIREGSPGTEKHASESWDIDAVAMLVISAGISFHLAYF